MGEDIVKYITAHRIKWGDTLTGRGKKTVKKITECNPTGIPTDVKK
jgi:hypothetical protein